MHKSGAELKAKLMAEMEVVLDKALKEAEQEEKLTLTGIEDIALQARAAMGRGLTRALIEQLNESEVPGPKCSDCGSEMHYKGRKRRYVRTRSGEVVLERAYYHCPGCGRGLFPPG